MFVSFPAASVRTLLLALGALALSACAGTDFKRPDAQSLELGKATAADVTKVMGTPMATGELVRNGEKLKVARYGYAEGAGTGKYPGVTPARAQVFFTYNDVLVGEEFVSSFPNDATDFDESKVKAIEKGKSTRADVIALLGKPSGSAIYPMVKTRGETALLYTYAHVKGSVFNMQVYNKNLIVSLDAKGVVTDVEYTSSGEK